MKSAWEWFKAHWGLLLLALGALGAFLFGRSTAGNAKLDKLKLEQDVIDAQAKTKKVIAQQGHDAAVEQIQQEHAEAIEKMNVEQHEEAARLLEDPVALSAYLVRVGRS